jgi:DNA topoisomerase-1
MRTDSTHVAHQAIVEAREFISSKYGPEYIPPHARSFSRRVKGAQEAHEAIRPTKIAREPRLVKQFLTAAQFKLYQLIWQRMVASQMAAALYDNTSVDIKAMHSESHTDYLFRTSTSVLKFPGFTTLYSEGTDEAEQEDKKSSLLPQLKKDDELDLLGLYPERHFTQPPPRYTEATLIKMLEQWGIGRPSTYAPILSTIQEREYVSKTGGTFRPTELGIAVNDLLIQHFPDIINIEFTARMEDQLDDIAQNNRNWVSVVSDFFTPFEKDLENAFQRAERVQLTEQVTDEICPHDGKPLVVKIGRYGKFLACSGYPECKYTQPFRIKTGAKCPVPNCGGDLVEKVTKKKRTFYGCSKYPECDFAINYRPLPQPCPECGGLLTVYRQKWQKCTKCDYKGKLETAKPTD